MNRNNTYLWLSSFTKSKIVRAILKQDKNRLTPVIIFPSLFALTKFGGFLISGVFYFSCLSMVGNTGKYDSCVDNEMCYNGITSKHSDMTKVEVVGRTGGITLESNRQNNELIRFIICYNTLKTPINWHTSKSGEHGSNLHKIGLV